MTHKPNYIPEVITKILGDRKGRKLPELTDAEYFPFLESAELLLGDPDFVHQHMWETYTLEHPVNRPSLDAANKAECEKKISITMVYCDEKDALGDTVFVGYVGTMAVDGYVLAKGRSIEDAKVALKELFKKVNTWAREWKQNYGINEAAGEEMS